MAKETVADDVASRIDEPTFRGIASVEGFDAALEVYREELLKPFDEWWTRYQAVLEEGPMYELGRIIARLREP